MGITRRYKDTTLEHELTKPCPLMPDGGWRHNRIIVEYDGTSIYLFVDGDEYDKGYIQYGGSTIPQNEWYIREPTGDALYISNDAYNHSGLAECRIYIPYCVNTTGNVQMQGSAGWIIFANNLQKYYIFSSFTQLLSGFPNITTRTKILELHAYYYIIKND